MSARLKPSRFLAGVVVSGLCALPVYAQYAGPSSSTAQSANVSTIAKDPIDDQQSKSTLSAWSSDVGPLHPYPGIVASPIFR